MGYGRAHMKEEAFRAVLNFRNREGDESVKIVGPYASVGAAKGQATSQKGSIERWSDGKVTSIRIQRATGWEDVEN